MNPIGTRARGIRALLRAGAIASALAGSLFGGTPLLACVSGNDHPKCQRPFTAIYVFGDSLSDTGRTAAVIDPAPPPDTDWLNGRESNGPLWIEYLSPLLGLKYQPLNNFAWCGATSGRENTNGAELPGLLDQLDEFLATLPSTGADPDALYVVFGGSNDFLAVLRGEKDPATALPEAIGNLVTIVATLKTVGAQHVVVMGVPDISLTPRVRIYPPEIIAMVNGMCVQFEAGLRATLDQYGLDVTYVSTVALLNDMAARPRRYGFVNVTEPSLPDLLKARRSMFWNDVHPTTLTHAWLAWTVFEALDVKPAHRTCRPLMPSPSLWPRPFPVGRR